MPFKYSAILKVENNKKIYFNNKDFNIGADAGDLLIDVNNENGSAILNAITNKKRISLKLFNQNRIFASAIIDTSPTDARDIVYEEEKKLVLSSDPKYCNFK